jgi:DNA-binding NtrC family response regulator
MKPETSTSVLVVGGGVRIRDQLCLSLSKENCLIRVTGNEKQALELIKECAPEVVFMDPSVSELGVPAFRKSLLGTNPRSRLVLIVSSIENCNRPGWQSANHILRTPFTQRDLHSALAISRNDNPN